MKTLTITALLCLLNLASASANVNCKGLFYEQDKTPSNPITFELTRETVAADTVQFFRTTFNDFLYTVSIDQDSNSISARISGLTNERGGSNEIFSSAGFGKSGIFEIGGAKAGSVMFPSAYVAIHCELEK
jgi:hypothetical protein